MNSKFSNLLFDEAGFETINGTRKCKTTNQGEYQTIEATNTDNEPDFYIFRNNTPIRIIKPRVDQQIDFEYLPQTNGVKILKTTYTKKSTKTNLGSYIFKYNTNGVLIELDSGESKEFYSWRTSVHGVTETRSSMKTNGETTTESINYDHTGKFTSSTFSNPQELRRVTSNCHYQEDATGNWTKKECKKTTLLANGNIIPWKKQPSDDEERSIIYHENKNN